MSLIWSILLMFMLTYVVGSMVGVPFDLQTALVLGIVATILVNVITFVLPKPAEQDGHH
jgi:hypothetical protein